MVNYKKTIQKKYPGTHFQVKGDETKYASIKFTGATSYTAAQLLSDWIGVLKAERNKEIDLKTQDLFKAGFQYDGQTFSLSQVAQTNWVAMDAVRSDLTYPLGVSTIDDGEYVLADEATLHAFALTAMGTGQAYYNSGRALKQAIKAAVTEPEINAIVDPR